MLHGTCASRSASALRHPSFSHLHPESGPRNAVQSHLLVGRSLQRDGAHGHAPDPADQPGVPELVLVRGHHHGQQLLRPVNHALPAAEHQDRPELLQLGRMQLRCLQQHRQTSRDGKHLRPVRHQRRGDERTGQSSDSQPRNLEWTPRDRRAVRLLCRPRRADHRVQLGRPLRTQHGLSGLRSILRTNHGSLPQPHQLLQQRVNVLGRNHPGSATALLGSSLIPLPPEPHAQNTKHEARVIIIMENIINLKKAKLSR